MQAWHMMTPVPPCSGFARFVGGQKRAPSVALAGWFRGSPWDRFLTCNDWDDLKKTASDVKPSDISRSLCLIDGGRRIGKGMDETRRPNTRSLSALLFLTLRRAATAVRLPGSRTLSMFLADAQPRLPIAIWNLGELLHMQHGS